MEQHDEWLTMGKRYLPQGSMTRLLGGIPGTTLAERCHGTDARRSASVGRSWWLRPPWRPKGGRRGVIWAERGLPQPDKRPARPGKRA